MPLFEESTMQYLSAGLDAAALRQEVTAHNLSNLNTPRFSRSSVSFEEELQQARQRENGQLERTHPQHQPSPAADLSPSVERDQSSVRRIDGNNVDMDQEMLELVNNQFRFNAMSQQVSDRFETWQYMVNEVGRG